MIEINEVNFKRLMNLWWLSLVLVFVSAFLEDQQLVYAAEAIVEGSGLFSDDVLGAMALILIIGWVVSGVMLYRLKLIGRSSFLALQVLGIVFTGLSGYTVLSPHMYAVDGINMMLSGAILVLAYTPQGSQLFVQKVDG